MAKILDPVKVLSDEKSDYGDRLVRSVKGNEQMVVVQHGPLALSQRGQEVLDLAIAYAQRICGDPSFSLRIEVKSVEYLRSARLWRVVCHRVQFFTPDAMQRGFSTVPYHMNLDFIVRGQDVQTAQGRRRCDLYTGQELD